MSTSIGKTLDSIPLHMLIATPFISVSDAQTQLTTASLNFIDGIMHDPIDNTKPRELVSFDKIVNDSNGVPVTTTIQVPLISLVNLPCMYIQKMNVDLVVEVDASSSSMSKSTDNLDTSFSVSGNMKYHVPSFSASLNSNFQTGSKLSSVSANNDSMNTKAKYVLHIDAVNEKPAGLTKVLDFLTNSS